GTSETTWFHRHRSRACGCAVSDARPWERLATGRTLVASPPASRPPAAAPAPPLLRVRYLARPIVNPEHDRTDQVTNESMLRVENAASQAASEGSIDSLRTNSCACGASISRSMPASSHSAERGPS